MYVEKDDWKGDPHRHNPDVHYRLYVGRDGATVICVQDFDYSDYDARCILSPEAWDIEAEAELALMEMLPIIGVADRALTTSLAADMRIRMLAASVREIRSVLATDQG